MSRNDWIKDERYFDITKDSRFPLAIPIVGWKPLGAQQLDQPKSLNIYLIRARNRIYVGSDTKGVRLRWHREAIKRKNHSNALMKNIGKKYGINAFEYLRLLRVPDEFCQFRNEIENAYIEYLDVFQSSHGMNLAEYAEAPSLGRKLSKETRDKISRAMKRPERIEHIKRLGLQKAKNYILVSPDGYSISIHNMAKFLRENGLHDSKMSDLLSGKIDHYKGWRRYEPHNIGIPFDSYRFIDPEGHVVETRNIKEFSISIDKNPDSFYKLLSGKMKSAFGYRNFAKELVGIPYKRPKPKSHWKVVSPNGELRQVYDFDLFAQDLNVTIEDLRKLFECEILDLKGWRLAGEEYWFFDPLGQIVKIRNLKRFAEKNSLNRTNMSAVYWGRGRFKSHKGYTSARQEQLAANN